MMKILEEKELRTARRTRQRSGDSSTEFMLTKHSQKVLCSVDFARALAREVLHYEVILRSLLSV